VSVGSGRLLLPGAALKAGSSVRLQLLARDLILATQAPQGLSVRNQLQGIITSMVADGPQNLLVSIDAAGVLLLARITQAAARDLQLQSGQSIWVLVKAVSLRELTHP
jgi:molybdate transport system ATP-binding protein